MAGFFGLFSGKTKYIDEIDDSTPIVEEKKEAFFLEPDEAGTLGNVDFMRKQITTRRTFPKTLKGDGGELIQSVSSTEKVELKKEGLPVINPKTEAIAPDVAVPNERRSSDNSLDMFRKMARDMKN